MPVATGTTAHENKFGPLMVSLSNHEWTAPRQAQDERAGYFHGKSRSAKGGYTGT